jgi:hypothetical protein
MAHSELKPRVMQSALGGAVTSHFKDAILDELADIANVAQFVSFSPGKDPQLRFARVRGVDVVPRPLKQAIETLMARTADNSVNVRSFDPAQPKANPLKYGLKRPAQVAYWVRRLARQGLHTIVNETIDVKDGGVSGVAFGGIMEFGPGDTPRIVERAGTASLPLDVGLRMLKTVYGFSPDLDFPTDVRVEFSIHPLRRGVREAHTIIWELERIGDLALGAEFAWPNVFSRHIGDKTFGLLVAEAIGLNVPETIVVSRNVAPFRFGKRTGTGERWLRTSPTEQTPGKFTTQRGWVDPFKLMRKEDRTGKLIASVLDQEGVDAQYSGAAVAGQLGRVTIEGVAGYGDSFMKGEAAPERLPDAVIDRVTSVFEAAVHRLGPVRFEWVMDDQSIWVVQLHRGATATSGRTIYPGTPSVEHRFEVRQGLEALRELVGRLPAGKNHGVVLIGSVGVTSHFGDILRRAGVPSRIEDSPSPDG